MINVYHIVVVVRCPSPPNMTHAFWNGTKDNYTFTTTIKYTCDEGYTFGNDITSATVDCRSNKTWSYPHHECQRLFTTYYYVYDSWIEPLFKFNQIRF